MSAAERMRAYRKRKRDAGFRNVRTWQPGGDDCRQGYSDHRILDARSLAMHCMIAKKIEGNLELLDIARQNLVNWTEKNAGERPRCVQEWEEILGKPWPEIAPIYN